MTFRTTIPQEELASKLTEADDDHHGTVYQPSRGGYFPDTEPAAGSSENQNR